jgi:hypothetical protein
MKQYAQMRLSRLIVGGARMELFNLGLFTGSLKGEENRKLGQ